MAASSSDVRALVAQLRGKGLDDAQVVEGLTGMGYSKAEAQAAVGTPKKPAAKKTAKRAAPKTARGGARTAGGPKPSATSTPPSPSGGSPRASSGAAGPKGLTMPKVQPPDFSQVTLTPPRRLGSGDLAGFLGGVALYCLALNFLRHGVDGPKGWLSAKLFNRPLDVDERSGNGSSWAGTKFS